MSYSQYLEADKPPARRPGHPSDANARMVKVGVLMGRRLHGRTAREEAERLRVSKRTIQRWTKRAQDYPETKALMSED
jgi:hypothetical protein